MTTKAHGHLHYRASSIQGIMQRIKAKGVEVIVANRITVDLGYVGLRSQTVTSNGYSRDLFGQD